MCAKTPLPASDEVQKREVHPAKNLMKMQLPGVGVFLALPGLFFVYQLEQPNDGYEELLPE